MLDREAALLRCKLAKGPFSRSTLLLPPRRLIQKWRGRFILWLLSSGRETAPYDHQDCGAQVPGGITLATRSVDDLQVNGGIETETELRLRDRESLSSLFLSRFLSLSLSLSLSPFLSGGLHGKRPFNP
jgi:hypothetical protein